MKEMSRTVTKSQWPTLSCRLLYTFAENERHAKGYDKITMTYFVLQIVIQVCWEWKKCQGQWQNHNDLLCLADCYTPLLRMKEMSRAMTKSQWPTLSCRLLYTFAENEKNVKGNDKITVTYFVLQVVVQVCWEWEKCQGQWQDHCDLLCLRLVKTRWKWRTGRTLNELLGSVS